MIFFDCFFGSHIKGSITSQVVKMKTAIHLAVVAACENPYL